jgi:hypothetical protein
MPASSGIRRQQLEERIREVLGLIVEYERKRDIASDPKEKGRCEDELEDLKGRLANYRAELAEETNAPFQAPPDLANFVGRERELDELRKALADGGGTAALCGLKGMGGIGKTAIAIHLAHQMRDQFPDGVLWARPDISEPMTILAAFAQAYGADVASLPDEASRAAFVRQLLSDKRVLIVLDNVVEAEPLRWLLPGGKCCAVVVTSRNRNVLERAGLRVVDVDRLPEEEHDEAAKQKVAA